MFNNKQENNPIELLAAVYGKDNAKRILKQIQKIKDKNPGKVYSFIFNEDGSFEAIEKSKEKEEEKKNV